MISRRSDSAGNRRGVRLSRRPKEWTSAWALAPALTLVLGIAVVALARWGPDWPAQEFRAWVAAHDGLGTWTSRWYGGEALPGYSVLYPPLASVLGSGVVGVASVVVAAWATTSMAPQARARGRWFAIAVAASLTESLLIGQIPYLLGVAFAMVAVRSLLRGGSSVLVGILALLCSLSSPLAGACLLLAIPAFAITFGLRRAAWLGTAVAGMGVAAVVGGASGPFPFPWQSLAGVIAFGVIALAASSDNRALRWFAVCYLCAAVLAFALPNSVGGNAARMGKLIALPLAVRFINVPPAVVRRMVAAAVVVVAAVWPSVAFASSIARGAGDPSQRPDYYRGLTTFLRTQDPSRGRVEIPFTREHWESLWVARTFPIARGWERQTDLLYNAVLYRPLSPATYRHWLDDNSVSLVALPTAPIDYGGQAEQELLEHPPSYLTPVWHDHNWQVWRVIGSRLLVSGAATLSSIDSGAIVLSFSHAGEAVVRVHASPLWQVDGAGCVDATPTGWLRVYSDRAGPVTLRAGLNSGLVTGTTRCRH